MTVDECIRAYKKVAKQAFTRILHKSLVPKSPSGSFSAAELEAAIKQTIREHCVSPACVIERSKGRPTVQTCKHEDMIFRDSSCTKT